MIRFKFMFKFQKCADNTNYPQQNSTVTSYVDFNFMCLQDLASNSRNDMELEVGTNQAPVVQKIWIAPSTG